MDVVNFYDLRFGIGFTDQQKQDRSTSSIRFEIGIWRTSFSPITAIVGVTARERSFDWGCAVHT